MVTDFQIDLVALKGLLDVCGEFFDIFKVATGTSRLFSRDHLRRKLAVLREHQVRSLLGGQFQEYVLHTVGIEAFPQHLAEAKDLGFDIVEVSDNIVDLGPGTREKLFDMIRELGMSPIGEIGDKLDTSAPELMVEETQKVLGGGSEFAILEGQEMLVNGNPNERLITLLADSVDVTRCMFELPTIRVGSTLPEIYSIKKFLINAFGPDVNLGNVKPDSVIETEATRLGLGAAGPLDLMLSMR